MLRDCDASSLRRARRTGIEGPDDTRSWDPDSEEQSENEGTVMKVVVKGGARCWLLLE